MSDPEARKRWMGLMARAPGARLAALAQALPAMPAHDPLRAPEIGGVMVQGRMGGSGQPFNLGEMTVTRASVQIGSGEVGHAYDQGRDKAKAETAALLDALMQTARAAEVEAAVLAPLAAEEAARRTSRAAKAAATKVDFFTMVRGE